MTTKRILLPVLLAAIALATATGCTGNLFGLNLFIVGEQTSLEKQVLGTYSALGEDLLVYSSVRGVDPNGRIAPRPETTESQRAAFAAMRNREYNRDDIDRMLASKVAGESNTGTLVRRDGSAAAIGFSDADIDRLIGEENTDRDAVLKRLMETSGTTDAQRAEVAWIFARLNQDSAPANTWVQRRDGTWSVK